MGKAERLFTAMERCADIERDFPGLRGGNYTPTSEADESYNCFAYAVGDTHNFWQYPRTTGYYWLPEVPDTLAGWVTIFRIHGYTETSDSSLESEYEKIAIYATDDGPQHVARQKASGAWTSKLGKGRDIEHDLRAVEGTLYGKVVVTMRRECHGKRVLE